MLAGTRGDKKKRAKGDGRSSRSGRRRLAGSVIAWSGARKGGATGGQATPTAHERGAEEAAGGVAGAEAGGSETASETGRSGRARHV